MTEIQAKPMSDTACKKDGEMEARRQALEGDYGHNPRVFAVDLISKVSVIACALLIPTCAIHAEDSFPLPSQLTPMMAKKPVSHRDSESNRIFPVGQNVLEDRMIAQGAGAPVPESLLPNGEELPSPAEITARKFPPTISAKKMTIRTEPGNRRLVDSQLAELEGEGKSLRAIQDELESNEKGPDFSRQDFLYPSLYTWEGDLPYGKYIYIHHSPLLFEDIPLERYGEGHGHCVQPVVSFFKFMGTVPLLPYKIPADYWAAQHSDLWYSFDQYGNVRPGITEGQFFPFATARNSVR